MTVCMAHLLLLAGPKDLGRLMGRLCARAGNEDKGGTFLRGVGDQTGRVGSGGFLFAVDNHVV